MTTAVAAPADPFGELFDFLDTLTVLDCYRLIVRLQLMLIGRLAQDGGL